MSRQRREQSPTSGKGRVEGGAGGAGCRQGAPPRPPPSRSPPALFPSLPRSPPLAPPPPPPALGPRCRPWRGLRGRRAGTPGALGARAEQEHVERASPRGPGGPGAAGRQLAAGGRGEQLCFDSARASGAGGVRGQPPAGERRGGMSSDDPYAVLGLDRTAGAEDVKRAFRALAKRFHPDLCAPGAWLRACLAHFLA